MAQRQHLRRSAVIAGTVAALVLSGTIATAVGTGQNRAAGPAGDPPPTTTRTVPTDPTTLPTTTDPTSTTITEPTTTTTEPPTTTTTFTSPTTTTTLPTTTTTTIPPRCVDPGPRPPAEQPGSGDPAVGPNGGSSVNDALIAVGGRLLDLWIANGYPGFAGVIANPFAGVLTLYWRAGEPLPPEVAAVVANPGQPVSVFRADSAYGRSQLESAAQGVADNTALSDQICAFIHTIKVLEEGSGLIVGVEPYDGTFNPFQAQQVLAAAAGVPVSIEVGPQTEYAARLNDVAPWFAGGGLTAGNTFCSAAFGVVDAGTRTREYMLTADHCFGLGVQVRNGNGTAILGPVALNRPQHDSEVIRVTAAGTNTFFGGVGAIGAPERNAPVRVPAANVRGVTVACTSGASTGENCALAVVATNAITMRRVIIGGRAFLQRQTNMVFASSTVRRANGQMAVAVGSGDSGGPVVTDTSHDREALGTISAGQNPVGCGIFAAPRKLCFSTVIYADINTLLRSYVAALR